MATKRIKDISTTATTFAADDFIALDASSVGTRKMAKASLITQVGANYLEKADNLSDVASKDTSKLNLEVPNVGTAANEVSVNGMLGDLAFQSSAGVVVDDLTVDGQLTAAVGKPMPVNGPTMRFDGSDDEVSFAATTDSPFSFTSGTDDTPFAITCWVKMTDATSFVVVSKQQSAREYVFRTDSVDKLRLNLSDGTNVPETEVNAALTEYENQWVHLCVTYSGAGPNSSRAFSDAASGIQFYINAKLVATTATNKASYSGMNASSDQVRIGKQSTAFADGEIRDVKLFNKELSDAEVREVYSNGQLGFAESTGTADGGIYTQDATPSGEWLVERGTDSDVSGPIGGKSDVLGFTVNTANTNHYLRKLGPFVVGKKYKVTFDYYISSANDVVDGIRLYCGGYVDDVQSNVGSWNYSSVEFVADDDDLRIYAFDGNSNTVNDPAGNDIFYISDLRITQIGSVLDARAEQFDTSTGKLYDLSGNDFVGTQSGGVSLLGREFPVYETGTWTPSVSFGGGSTGVTFSTQEGYYTRIGNQATVHGRMTLTSKGSSTGTFRIEGLPFSAYASAGSMFSAAIGYSNNWDSSITEIPSLVVETSTTKLFASVARSGSLLSDTAIANSTDIRFSATYQIQ